MNHPECDYCQEVWEQCTECQGCFGEHCTCDPCQHGKARSDECVFCRRGFQRSLADVLVENARIQSSLDWLMLDEHTKNQEMP